MAGAAVDPAGGGESGDGPVARLAGLSWPLDADERMEPALLRVARLAQQAIPGCDGVGVSVRGERSRAGAIATAAATDDLVRALDGAQYREGAGPCLDAARGELVWAGDLTTDPRWPQLWSDAAAVGLRCCLSVPLLVDPALSGEDDRPVGALNLYAARPDAYGEQDRRAAELFAAQAAVVVRNVQLYHAERAARAEAERTAAAAEQARDRVAEAQDRLVLLARLSEVLASTPDVREALRRLCRLVVPRLADAAVADLLVDDLLVEQVVVWSRDPDRVDEPMEGRLRRPGGAADSLSRVLHGGPPVLLSTIPPARTASDRLPAARLELLAGLGATSAIVAPIRTHRQVLGALTLVRADPAAPYTPADLELVEDVARRAALAVGTARTFAQDRQTAEMLQRSLLAEPPQADPLQVAVRYQPASTVSQVGGDWYDAFRLPDGTLALVVGDVAGHDMAAAVQMGQLRNLLRGIAVDTGAGCSEVVTRLDRAAVHLRAVDMATALYARVEPASGPGWELRWCNAGHPPPLLVLADGTSELLDEPRGVLLGLSAGGRRDGHRRLPPGSTLLLYTDGLVDTRDLPVDVGLIRLGAHAAQLADRPLEQMADELLHRLGRDAEDDVALVAVRLPPDRRPPDSGHA